MNEKMTIPTGLGKTPPATISIDVRSDRVHSGKTTVCRLIAKALRDAGLDTPENPITINNQDQDLPYSAIATEEFQNVLDAGLDALRAKQKAKSLHFHLADTNLRPLAKPYEFTRFHYEFRERNAQGYWSGWKGCTLPEVSDMHRQNNESGEVRFETRSIFQREGGTQLRVPENWLSGIITDIKNLNALVEHIDYNDPVHGKIRSAVSDLIVNVSSFAAPIWVEGDRLRDMLAGKVKDGDFFNQWTLADDQPEQGDN
ncbi:hypothetical protein pEaSNUABM54_00182 [Erwinia phage pEa_SNUABM_54]|nr:hypothetical protein pEaSNUABM54_00182 [Erwinia phage pEa_SNUABM_54]